MHPVNIRVDYFMIKHIEIICIITLLQIYEIFWM